MVKRGAVLVDAIAECERFLKVAKAYKPSENYADDAMTRAAAKRASMDASRALSKLRRAYSHDWNDIG
jgi:hypothetical protein